MQLDASPKPLKNKILVLGGGVNGITLASLFARLPHYNVTVVESASGAFGPLLKDSFLPQDEDSFLIPSVPLKVPLHEGEPLAKQVQTYLLDAVREFDIDLKTNIQVSKFVCKVKYGWYVTLIDLSSKDGNEETVFFDKVVVSDYGQLRGINRSNSVASVSSNIKTQNLFKGQQISDADIRNLDYDTKSLLAGKKVVVVGFGSNTLSTLKTVVDSDAASVTHVFVTPRWVLPKFSLLFGLFSWKNLLLTRLTSYFIPTWEYPTTVQKYVHKYGGFIVSTFWKLYFLLFAFIITFRVFFIAAFYNSVFKVFNRKTFTFTGLVLLPWDFVAAGREGVSKVATVFPSRRIAVKNQLKNSFLLDNSEYFSLIARKKVEPIHGEIHLFTEKTIILKDTKQEIEADVIIIPALEGSATPDFSALPQRYHEFLAKEKKLQFYRHLISPEVPNFAFSPIASGSSSTFLHNAGFHVIVAEAAVLWLDAYWSGQLELPPKEEILAVIDRVRDWKVNNIDNKEEHTSLSVVNARFQAYVDLILFDLKLNPYRKSFLFDFFVKYTARDYQNLLSEYLRIAGGEHLKAIKLSN